MPANSNKALLARSPDYYSARSPASRSDFRLAHRGSAAPAHPLFRKVLKSLDFPLAAPSANLSNSTKPTCPQHILDSFGEKAPKVLEGGSCEIGLESTVVSLVDEENIQILARAPSAKRNWKKYLAKLLPNPKLLRTSKVNKAYSRQAKSISWHRSRSLCSQNSFVFI